MSGDGVGRRVREMKGRDSDGAGTGDEVRKIEGTGEGGPGLGVALREREVVAGEVFGRGRSCSEVIVTKGDSGM